jgi:hypothetical protein
MNKEHKEQLAVCFVCSRHAHRPKDLFVEGVVRKVCGVCFDKSLRLHLKDNRTIFNLVDRNNKARGYA